MNFTKIIKNEKINFEITEDNESSLCLEVTIPAHGDFKRHDVYSLNEFNKLALEHLKGDLVAQNSTGRVKSKRNTAVKVCLIFKKKKAVTKTSHISDSQKKSQKTNTRKNQKNTQKS